MHNLTWTDGRWHLNGQGIHAGEYLEILCRDGTWQVVRIESGDAGRKLYAHFTWHEQPVAFRIDDSHELRLT